MGVAEGCGVDDDVRRHTLSALEVQQRERSTARLVRVAGDANQWGLTLRLLAMSAGFSQSLLTSAATGCGVDDDVRRHTLSALEVQQRERSTAWLVRVAGDANKWGLTLR